MSSLQERLDAAKAAAGQTKEEENATVKDPTPSSFTPAVEVKAPVTVEEDSETIIKQAQEKGFRVFKPTGLKRFFLPNGKEVKPVAGVFVAVTPEMEKELVYFSEGYSPQVEEITK